MITLSWSKPGGGLSPRSSDIPKNLSAHRLHMSHPAEGVVAFYNKRGTCEQWIKEGKCAIRSGFIRGVPVGEISVLWGVGLRVQ
jgi:hypothetical protein